MTYREFFDKADNERGWIIAAYTDRYIVDGWPMTSAEQKEYVDISSDKALEVRIFSENREIMLSRSDIGRDFTFREIDDMNTPADSYYDEVQFLDVDTDSSSRLEGKAVLTTGGGRYYLPLDSIDDAKIRIRYYLESYPGTGQARIADWRVVELMEG